MRSITIMSKLSTSYTCRKRAHTEVHKSDKECDTPNNTHRGPHVRQRVQHPSNCMHCVRHANLLNYVRHVKRFPSPPTVHRTIHLCLCGSVKCCESTCGSKKFQANEKPSTGHNLQLCSNWCTISCKGCTTLCTMHQYREAYSSLTTFGHVNRAGKGVLDLKCASNLNFRCSGGAFATCKMTQAGSSPFQKG